MMRVHGGDDRDELTTEWGSKSRYDDVTGEADGMNQGVDSRDGVMHYLNERSVIFNEEMVGGRERVTTDEERDNM